MQNIEKEKGCMSTNYQNRKVFEESKKMKIAKKNRIINNKHTM